MNERTCLSGKTISAGTLLLVALVMAGCTQNPAAVKATGSVGNAVESLANTSSKVIGGPLIPDSVIQIGPSVSYPLEKLVYWGLYVGAAWLIVDPLAPNWEIEEARLPDDYVHFSLKMKRIYSGGAGEARAVLDRRAKALVREGGYQGYELVEYAERLDSSVLGSQRKAEGVIRLLKKVS
ncbi:MAG: hypothetical protein ACOY6N_03935 [Pseudomonadota bacterium]